VLGFSNMDRFSVRDPMGSGIGFATGGCILYTRIPPGPRVPQQAQSYASTEA